MVELKYMLKLIKLFVGFKWGMIQYYTWYVPSCWEAFIIDYIYLLSISEHGDKLHLSLVTVD